MAFRLRRGTDTERQSVVFAEGELVYTTDTKELYVGDGTTLGGIRITGSVEVSPIALTRNLDMNGFDIVGSGDIDISGVVSADSFNGDGSGLTNLPALDVNNGASYQINIVGADSSIIVNSNTSEVSGDLIGNVKGSVFNTDNEIMIDNVTRSIFGDLYGDVFGNVVGSDSSVLVNTIANTLNGPLNTSIINADNNRVTVNPTIAGSNILSIESLDTRSILSLTKTSESNLQGVPGHYGAIWFGRNDVNGGATTALILGQEDALLFSSASNSTFAESTFITIRNNGCLGVGTFTPDEKLDVRGNGKFTGFVKFGSLTSTDIAELTPSNGMVLYNSTSNRFQGYQNGTWINLDDGTTA